MRLFARVTSELGREISAVVSRGGRPDLAIPRLREVTAPTLLIVGGDDTIVIEMNQDALGYLNEGRLIGSKCKQCGSHFFPKRHVCIACYHREVEEVLLGTRGKIDTFTVSRMPLPGSVITTAPYGIANVKLPEGVIVETVLTDCDVESLTIGMDVDLVINKVKENDEGQDVMAYFFSPSKT